METLIITEPKKIKIKCEKKLTQGADNFFYFVPKIKLHMNNFNCMTIFLNNIQHDIQFDEEPKKIIVSSKKPEGRRELYEYTKPLSEDDYSYISCRVNEKTGLIKSIVLKNLSFNNIIILLNDKFIVYIFSTLLLVLSENKIST